MVTFLFAAFRLMLHHCQPHCSGVYGLNGRLAQNVGLDMQGVYGWKLSPAVKSYRSYEKWDPPPEPEPFQVHIHSPSFTLTLLVD